MPFTCPTCGGTGLLADGGECFTCQRTGSVDPADPPSAEGAKGVFRTAWKIFFGTV